jgi:hypothetical protein
MRLLVVVAVVGLMTGCDLGPGEPPPLYQAVSQADDDKAKRMLDEGSDPDETYEGVPVIHGLRWSAASTPCGCCSPPELTRA